jgi:hypothetical protein
LEWLLLALVTYGDPPRYSSDRINQIALLMDIVFFRALFMGVCDLDLRLDLAGEIVRGCLGRAVGSS